MFKQVFSLSRLQLCNLFGLNVFRYTKDKSRRARFWLMAVAWVLVILIAIGYVTGLSVGMHMLGLASLIPVYLYTLVSLIVFLFSIFKAGSVVFSLKSYEMLTPLPVSRSAIVISRFLTMYVTNLLLGLLVMLPGMVVYGICYKPTLGNYVITIVVFLFMPLLPLTMSSIIGAGITALTSRMKNKGIGESVLMMLVVVGIMLGSSVLAENEEMLTKEVLANLAVTIEEAIRNVYPPAGWYAEVLEGEILPLVPLLGLPLVVFGLFVYVVGRNFQRICSVLAASSATNDYRMGKLQGSSRVKSLWKKELRRYFASGIYVSNTIIGCVLALLFAGFVAVTGVEKLVEMLELPGAEDIARSIMPFVLTFMFTIMNMTACAVSMEGKNLWQIQTLPVHPKDVWMSKIYANLTVVAPFYVLAVVLMCIGLRANLSEIMWMILIPGAYICFMAFVGLKINLWLPVYDWEQEVQVVKQSASVLVSMLVGMLSVVIPLLLTLVFAAYEVMIKGITVIVLGVIMMLLYKNICKICF